MAEPCSNCLGTGFVAYEVQLSKRGIVIQERVQPCHLCQGDWRQWADRVVAEGNARRADLSSTSRDAQEKS